MWTLGWIESFVLKFEGFSVVARHESGRDVRSDKQVSGYSFERRAKGDTTVSEYKRTRLSRVDPNSIWAVLDDDEKPVHGNTKLKNLRPRGED